MALISFCVFVFAYEIVSFPLMRFLYALGVDKIPKVDVYQIILWSAYGNKELLVLLTGPYGSVLDIFNS